MGRGDAPAYAELHAHSSFSHLDGASTPEEMVARAAELGLSALALTDHDGMYGLPRLAAAAAARSPALPTIFGAELSCDLAAPATAAARSISARAAVPDPPGRHLLVLARDPTGYASLCQAISAAHRRGGAKGRPSYDWDELSELADGHWLVLTGCRKGPVRQALELDGDGGFALGSARRALAELVDRFGRENVAVELAYAREPLADERYDALADLADEAGLPVVATTGAHYHAPSRRRLATVLAAVRARRSLDELDAWLPAWADASLRSGAELAERFARWPGAVAAAGRLGGELAFDLRLIAPRLPPFAVPPPFPDEMAYLRHLAHEGAARRYGTTGGAIAGKVAERIAHELKVIEALDFPGYFLVAWDIARFCRQQGILYQGRGSAAGSAVCYALEITAIDPLGYAADLLFERFLAVDRAEPPDIDIDIESGAPREKVIQYVYAKYGRDNAAQVANSITYRPKLAVRDVAKALGYSTGQQDAWSKEVARGYWTTKRAVGPSSVDPTRANGAVDERSEEHWSPGPADWVEGAAERIPSQVLELAAELVDAPRHLGVHSGGMVICDRPIVRVCPVEWARLTERAEDGTRRPIRSVLQWDKHDCEYAKLVKFDLLGLGMLAALRHCFALISSWHGASYELATIPKEQPCVYEMICRADTVGVFQIESRAQMQALPRARPQRFYQLAIQVALVRPGPIQGGAVHPYIRRRNGLEEVNYPHPSLKPALERTLGVPLFQEQLMEIAIDGAGFSPGEADQLRRAMGSKRGVERVEAMEGRLREGLAGNGIVGAVADDVVARVKAFGSFGFAESHSLSFALLAYVSAWLKLHYPAAYLAALLRAQPMGFYSPQTLVHDAKRHGVVVRRPDINASAAQTGLEAVGAAAAGAPGSGDLASAGVASGAAGATGLSGAGVVSGGAGGAGAGAARCGCPPIAQPAVRLGLDSVRAISAELAEAIVAERERRGLFTSLDDLARRSGLTAGQLEALATAGAFDGFSLSRRDALWIAGAAADARPDRLDVPRFDVSDIPALPELSEPEQLIADMWATGVTPDAYPTALIRDRLTGLGVVTAAELRKRDDRSRVIVGGIVTHRQRPGTARGVTFLNLEDETGMVNVICSAGVWARHQRIARDCGGLLIHGRLERAGEVANVLAERIERLPIGLRTRSRDFR
ncbi:MAG: error-prone DNA polymerase [Actinomycetia bacterium]|nr:error-prone DNA polymerase [Actinomycetes bacterium]